MLCSTSAKGPTESHQQARSGECPTNGVNGVFIVIGPGLWHAVGEGDSERVQGWFPPYGPPCLTGTFRAQGPGDQVQALHRGLLGGEVSAGLDRPAVSGVQALDGVRRADDLADLDVFQERDELAPGVCAMSLMIAGYRLPHLSSKAS